MKMLAIIGLSLVAAYSSVAPVQAFPTMSGAKLQVSDIQKVDNRLYSNRWSGSNGGVRYLPRGGVYGRPYGGYSGYGGYGGYVRYGGYGRYSGYGRYGGYGGYARYRGYGRYPGYGFYGGYGRYFPGNGYYDDFGAAFGGLAAGAIIGGLAAQPRYYRYEGNNSHISWCYARYRSYRATDNTFQPYHGPRRQCLSGY